jgi:hypothetical protein
VRYVEALAALAVLLVICAFVGWGVGRSWRMAWGMARAEGPGQTRKLILKGIAFVAVSTTVAVFTVIVLREDAPEKSPCATATTTGYYRVPCPQGPRP